MKQTKEARLIRRRKWREANKEHIKAYIKEYRIINKDTIKETTKQYAKKNKDRLVAYNRERPEQTKLAKKKYYDSNREKIREYNRNYRTNRVAKDPLYKLTINLRSRISILLKDKGYSKTSTTYKILGCTYEEFKLHIESQWEDWMDWDNYGKYNGELNHGWDLDHIIPLSTANTENELLELCHFKNQQPLCSYNNRYIKRDEF